MMTFFSMNQWRNITGYSISCQRLRKAGAKKAKKSNIHNCLRIQLLALQDKSLRNMRKLLSLIILSLFLTGLAAKVTLKSYSRMEVDKRYDTLVPAELSKIMKSYKIRLDQVVNRPIGTSALYMESKAPESLLSNFLADQLWLKAAEFCPEGVDLSIINFGGIRAPLPVGLLTVGDIYRIMPFENELVVLELNASDLLTILKKIVEDGGEGISHVRIEVENGKISSLLIGGKPFDETRTYRVATMDYLADGNSGMTAFKNAVKRIDTHVKMRDAYISQIEKLTAQGKAVTSALDGRLHYTFK
jgi:2',3'-cyclic-nucleotide 2'-phosphodiesterase (5'-nucleotidase family)